MKDKVERIYTMMNEMEEVKKKAALNEVYDASVRDLLRRADEFTAMSDKAKEEVLELLAQIHKYYV